jgi:hypothetical protein
MNNLLEKRDMCVRKNPKLYCNGKFLNIFFFLLERNLFIFFGIYGIFLKREICVRNILKLLRNFSRFLALEWSTVLL